MCIYNVHTIIFLVYACTTS